MPISFHIPSQGSRANAITSTISELPVDDLNAFSFFESLHGCDRTLLIVKRR